MGLLSLDEILNEAAGDVAFAYYADAEGVAVDKISSGQGGLAA